MSEAATAKSAAKALLLFTLPLILSGLFQQLFNWVDAFIVGNVEGELALAGIGATTSLYNLFVTVITGFTSGLAVLSAQLFGRGEKEKIRKVLSTYTILMGAAFLLIAAAGIFFAERILHLMNTPEHIFGSAESYLRIILIGVPFLAVYNTYSAVLRGVGNSRVPFIAVLISSGVNVVLDLLFVAGLGYGAAGAAAATAIAQAAMTVYVILYTCRRYPLLRFRFGKEALDPLRLRYCHHGGSEYRSWRQKTCRTNVSFRTDSHDDHIPCADHAGSGAGRTSDRHVWSDRSFCHDRRPVLSGHRRILCGLRTQHGSPRFSGRKWRYVLLRRCRNSGASGADRRFLCLKAGL